MTDFRSLCSQLLSALEVCTDFAYRGEHGCPTFDGDQLDSINHLLRTTRAALEYPPLTALEVATNHMSKVHPITPPPELVEQWRHEWTYKAPGDNFRWLRRKDELGFLALRGAQWGADQELEACCEWLEDMMLAGNGDLELLRSDRRPKPPSLKEQALNELAEWENVMDIAPDSSIRRALEALDD